MNAKTAGIAIFGALLFAPTVAAQTMSVSPGNALRLNQTATITYVDKNKANTTVHVLVMGGLPIPTVFEVAIPLDGSGKGTGTWTLTDGSWMTAIFSAPDVSDIVIPIL